MIPGQLKKALSVMALLCGWASVSSASEPKDCPADLARLSCAELECLYRQAEPGRVPNGFAQGRVVYCPDTFLAGFKSGTSQLLWKGKHFCAEEGTLINQWCGIKAIRATIYQGTSWIDGKPAIILDYSDSSRIWHDMRDEMREISPGVYLGAMFQNHCPEPRLKLYFVLRTCD